MDSIKEMSGKDKIKELKNIGDIDIIDFVEDYLGCQLFEYQKLILREMYKKQCADNYFPYLQVLPRYNLYHIPLILRSCLEKQGEIRHD